MKLDLSAPTPLAYFASLVHSDEQLPLFEAAVSLAQDEYPMLDVQQVLNEVDRMAARLQRRVIRGAGIMNRLLTLNQLFFNDLGFGGNINDYYSPDNSYLHKVLATRRGIPISLAVLWLELARGLDLDAEGVSFPGHFLVQVRLGHGRVVVDPFTGASLSREELLERIEAFHPRFTLPLDSAAPLTLYLQAASSREILARMLRNLQEIHRTQHDWARFVAVQDRLVTLLPRAWEEYRDRGLALAELGQRERARADLQLYLREATEAVDRALMADRLAELEGAA